MAHYRWETIELASFRPECFTRKTLAGFLRSSFGVYLSLGVYPNVCLCKLLRGPGRVRIMQMRLSGRGGLGGVLGEHSRYHLSGPQTSGSEEASSQSSSSLPGRGRLQSRGGRQALLQGEQLVLRQAGGRLRGRASLDLSTLADSNVVWPVIFVECSILCVK